MSATTTTTTTTTFSNLSKRLTESLTKDEKKNGGIFFTPPPCIQHIMTLLRGCGGVSKTIHNILEPSCGSGEFITALSREYPDANITGIEYHPVIYKAVSEHFASSTTSSTTGQRIVIHHGDFLKYATAAATATATARPDLIIGNPPYFVMKKDEVAPEYYPYFDGRPNIFTLFIIKAAQLLSEGGILCFVLPSSFMNSQYYDKTRKYIVRHFTILHIVRCDDIPGSYIDTAQDTIIVMIQKRVGNDTPTSVSNHTCGVYEKSGATIFTDNLPRLTALYDGSQSLHELGFKVSVGTVVWNQCKNILTDDSTKTRLIYSSNIENGKFVHKTYKNAEKKAFINKPGIRTPMIVLNRGYGVGEYQFDYCLLTPEMVSSSSGYLIENHLICITSSGSGSGSTAFQRVIRSFQDPRTQEFISSYFGNNAMNHMLPIYA